MKRLALAAVVVLAACQTTTPETSLLISCRAYDGALRSLAGYRAAGELSAEQIATVNRWRPVLNAACTSDAPVTGSVLDQVEAGLIEILAIEEAVK